MLSRTHSNTHQPFSSMRQIWWGTVIEASQQKCKTTSLYRQRMIYKRYRYHSESGHEKHDISYLTCFAHSSDAWRICARRKWGRQMRTARNKLLWGVEQKTQIHFLPEISKSNSSQVYFSLFHEWMRRDVGNAGDRSAWDDGERAPPWNVLLYLVFLMLLGSIKDNLFRSC